MRNLICIAIATFLLPSLAVADFSLDTYRFLLKDPVTTEKLSDYVTGTGRGIFWANVLLGVTNKPPLFCPPSKFAFDEGVIQSLLDQEIRKPSKGTPYKGDTPIELILANAFMYRFPCSPTAGQ
jgi:hypothetical protein